MIQRCLIYLKINSYCKMLEVITSGLIKIYITDTLSWYRNNICLDRDLKFQIVLEFSVLSIDSCISNREFSLEDRKRLLEIIRDDIIPKPNKFIIDDKEFQFNTYGDMIDTLGPNVELGVKYHFFTKNDIVIVY